MSTAQLIAVALLLALSAAMLAALLGRSSRGGGQRTVSGRPLPPPKTSPPPAPVIAIPPPIELPEISPAHMFALLVEKGARIAELEHQRDEVLALCELPDIRLNDTVGAYAIDLAQEICKIYGGGE